MGRMIRSAGDGRRRGSPRAAQAPGAPPSRRSHRHPPPGRRSAAWAPLLAVALLAAAGVVLLDSRPAQAQLRDVEIWSATLIAKDLGSGFRGCGNHLAAGKKCSNSAVLTNDDVTYEGNTYTITNIYTEGTALVLAFVAATPFLSKPLTFHVDGARYAFADDTEGNGRTFRWIRSTAWTVGQTVHLKITGPPPLPPPRPAPDPDPDDPAVKPKRCACTQVAASYFPERCSKCAIIRSCGTT